MGRVLDLDAHRPHVVVSCGAGHVHVLPVALMEDLAAGRRAVDADLACVVGRVLGEWLAAQRAGD